MTESNQMEEDNPPEYHPQPGDTISQSKLANPCESDKMLGVEERFLELTEGQEVLVEMGPLPKEPPPWYDEEKFRRGQEFFYRHFSGIFLAHLVSLITLLGNRQILRPLIYTEKSETPWKAFCRYVGTVIHVNSWYLGNVWQEGNIARKSIQMVRNFHSLTAKITNAPEKKPVVDRADRGLCNDQCFHGKRLLIEAIQRDSHRLGQCPLKPMLNRKLPNDSIPYLNQNDMATAQFAFVGVVVLFPQRFGAVYCTDQDLQGFIHFWRCIGYLLGIQDRYNFCLQDDLNFIRQLSQFYLERVVKPSFQHISVEYEHMSRAIALGVKNYMPGVSFESLFYYNAFAVDLPLPKFRRSMTYSQWFHYLYLRLVLTILAWIPGFIRAFNAMLRFSMTLVVDPPSWWPTCITPPHVEKLAEFWIPHPL